MRIVWFMNRLVHDKTLVPLRRASRHYFVRLTESRNGAWTVAAVGASLGHIEILETREPWPTRGGSHASATRSGRGTVGSPPPARADRSRASCRQILGPRVSPGMYRETCSQREPKRAKVTRVRSLNLRRVVCGPLTPVSIPRCGETARKAQDAWSVLGAGQRTARAHDSVMNAAHCWVSCVRAVARRSRPEASSAIAAERR